MPNARSVSARHRLDGFDHAVRDDRLHGGTDVYGPRNRPDEAQTLDSYDGAGIIHEKWRLAPDDLRHVSLVIELSDYFYGPTQGDHAERVAG